MEVENNSSSTITCAADYSKDVEDDDRVRLPGFRFHPTDEELVGFYLKRKVEKRLIGFELIKAVDIYKCEPWDLPKSGNVGDKEWYFFCKRGRKYRNSIRPNRVTGLGFWKATGIDKPVYSCSKEGRDRVIGLKKSLVYYRGSAGKGTKTDWMMHEFRLPPAPTGGKLAKHGIMGDTIENPSAQEAEVWTLCRILKKTISYKKCLPEWRDSTAGSIENNPISKPGSKTCSNMEQTSYNICFDSQNVRPNTDQKPFSGFAYSDHYDIPINRYFPAGQFSGTSMVSTSEGPLGGSFYSGPICGDMDWGDLGSVVDSAAGGNITNPYYF